jgi:arabinofuranosyltransferase
VLVLPASRTGALAIGGLTLYAAACAAFFRVPYQHGHGQDGPTSARGFTDERGYWRFKTSSSHPIAARQFTSHSHGLDAALVASPGESPLLLMPLPTVDGRQLVFLRIAANPTLPWRTVAVSLTLGTNGAAVGLDDAAVDQIGLGYPLAAHARLEGRSRPGHEKSLPTPYLLADLAAPRAPAPFQSQAQLTQARTVLACPQVRELLASVRAPMTPSRFWKNLVGSWHRTRYRLPAPADFRGC